MLFVQAMAYELEEADTRNVVWQEIGFINYSGVRVVLIPEVNVHAQRIQLCARVGAKHRQGRVTAEGPTDDEDVPNARSDNR